jgi:hypothetical protein
VEGVQWVKLEQEEAYFRAGSLPKKVTKTKKEKTRISVKMVARVPMVDEVESVSRG